MKACYVDYERRVNSSLNTAFSKLLTSGLTVVKNHVLRYCEYVYERLGSEVINLFSCSAYLSMEFSLLINVKMQTISSIVILTSRKNSFLQLSEPKKAGFYFILMST